MLEHVLQDHCIEQSVVERKPLPVNVGVDDVATESLRLLDRFECGVDACVLREIFGEPRAPATDVQDLDVGIEVPRDVSVVARSLMPREIPHDVALRPYPIPPRPRAGDPCVVESR